MPYLEIVLLKLMRQRQWTVWPRVRPRTGRARDDEVIRPMGIVFYKTLPNVIWRTWLQALGRDRIRHPPSAIRHPPSCILHPSSRIPHPASLIPHPSSHFPHPASGIPHPACGSGRSLRPHPRVRVFEMIRSRLAHGLHIRSLSMLNASPMRAHGDRISIPTRSQRRPRAITTRSRALAARSPCERGLFATLPCHALDSTLSITVAIAHPLANRDVTTTSARRITIHITIRITTHYTKTSSLQSLQAQPPSSLPCEVPVLLESAAIYRPSLRRADIIPG